jgi:hypothetical protein
MKKNKSLIKKQVVLQRIPENFSSIVDRSIPAVAFGSLRIALFDFSIFVA